MNQAITFTDFTSRQTICVLDFEHLYLIYFETNYLALIGFDITTELVVNF